MVDHEQSKESLLISGQLQEATKYLKCYNIRHARRYCDKYNRTSEVRGCFHGPSGPERQILELDELPQNDEEHNVAYETLRNTLGIVDEIRSIFQSR